MTQPVVASATDVVAAGLSLARRSVRGERSTRPSEALLATALLIATNDADPEMYEYGLSDREEALAFLVSWYSQKLAQAQTHIGTLKEKMAAL